MIIIQKATPSTPNALFQKAIDDFFSRNYEGAYLHLKAASEGGNPRAKQELELLETQRSFLGFQPPTEMKDLHDFSIEQSDNIRMNTQELSSTSFQMAVDFIFCHNYSGGLDWIMSAIQLDNKQALAEFKNIYYNNSFLLHHIPQLGEVARKHYLECEIKALLQGKPLRLI